MSFFLFLTVSASVTVVPTLSIPVVSVIEDLGLDNVYWNPTQLYRMSVQTFKDALSTLGEITNFSAEQLSALRAKTLEVHFTLLLRNKQWMFSHMYNRI